MNDHDNTAHEYDDRAPGRKPDYIAYNVTESRDGKGYFNRVGAAWRHRDGQGYDVQLDSTPVNGRITLRELRDERTQGYEAQRQAEAERHPEPEPQRSRTRERDR